MRWSRRGAWALVAAVGYGLATPAFAASPCEKPEIEDAPLPNIAGCVSMRLFNDTLVRSELRKQARNELSATVEALTLLQLDDRFSIFVHKSFEPLGEARPGRSRTFQDHGFYVEEVYAAWREKNLFGADLGMELILGKWNLPFGRAYDDVFTVYGNDFASDYEFKERIGALLRVDIEVAEDIGVSPFAGVFTRDNWLTGTMFKSRGSLGPRDGGAGNTGKLDSFIVGASAEFKKLAGLEVWAAYADHARAPNAAERERAFVVGASLRWELGADVVLRPLIEYAHFAHFDNAAAERRDYLTLSLRADWAMPALDGRSRVVASYMLRDIRGQGDARARSRDGLLALTLGHKFDNALDLAVGYKYADDARIGAHSIGVLVTWKFDYGPYGRPAKAATNGT